MGTYAFCVRAIFIEAIAFVATGLLVGLLYRDWVVVVTAQLLLLICEMAGYWIEQWLHRRRVDPFRRSVGTASRRGRAMIRTVLNCIGALCAWWSAIEWIDGNYIATTLLAGLVTMVIPA
jgi:hypothetical protein